MNPARSLLVLSFLLLAVGCKGDPKVQRDKFFASAEQYFKDGKYHEASIQFRNALQQDQEHLPSYLGLARALQKLGEHQNAIVIFRRVISLDGKNTEAKIALGNYFLAGGAQNPELYKSAWQYADEVLAVAPGNTEASILLGRAFSGLNELDKAAQVLERVLTDNPDNLTAQMDLGVVQFRQNKPEKAEATYKNALSKNPNSIQVLLSIATFYATVHKPIEAEGYFRKAFDLAPDDGNSLNALVRFYVSNKREADAENVFKQALAKKPGARELRLGLAGFYLQRGKVDEGLQVLQEILNSNPEDRQVELLIADACLRQNRSAEAEQHVRALLSKDDRNADAHYLMGRILVARGENDKAYEEFERAIKANDSLLMAYLDKGSLLLSRGDAEGAQNALNEILKRDRNNLRAMGALAKVYAFKRMNQDALRLAQQVLEVMPANPDALAARADALASQGKFNEAKEDLKKLCNMQPDSPAYWHRLGTVEARQKDFAGAMTHFRKALELRPDYTPAINDILYLHIADRKFDAALAELDKLSKASTPQDLIHSFRGRIYLDQGRVSEAENEFRKSIEVNPRNYQGYLYLGELNVRRNNLQQAIKEVDQLIMKDSKYAPAFMMKAYYQQAARDTSGAIGNYRKFLELEPQNPVAANNLAWLLCQSNGNLDEALQLAQTARKNDPDNPEIADTLGWIHYKKKNFVLAIDQLLFSVNSRNAGAEHYYRLGMAYYGKGELLLARQTLRKALELNNSFDGADEARNILKQPQ